MNDLETLISDFVEQISAVIEANALDRVRENVSSVFSNGSRASAKVSALGAAPRRRKKGPIQMCPVPGCKNRAAPVFGMVCSEHKKVPKSKIRQYREARRAAKEGKPGKEAKPGKVAKRAAATRPAGASRKTKRRASPPKRVSQPARKRAQVRGKQARPAAAPAPAPAPSAQASA